mmetsp:Transcript_8208/g.21497  ORF Transcript_8208/g.21497 Transcript_8208/m.21497 type:complete len:238 (-) Transcript_8208:512-1225(-)
MRPCVRARIAHGIAHHGTAALHLDPVLFLGLLAACHDGRGSEPRPLVQTLLRHIDRLNRVDALEVEGESRLTVDLRFHKHASELVVESNVLREVGVPLEDARAVDLLGPHHDRLNCEDAQLEGVCLRQPEEGRLSRECMLQPPSSGEDRDRVLLETESFVLVVHLPLERRVLHQHRHLRSALENLCVPLVADSQHERWRSVDVVHNHESGEGDARLRAGDTRVEEPREGGYERQATK